MGHFLCTMYINCKIFSDQRHHAISFLQQHVFVKRIKFLTLFLTLKKHRFVKRSNHTRSPHTIVVTCWPSYEMRRCSITILDGQLCWTHFFTKYSDWKDFSLPSTCAIYFCTAELTGFCSIQYHKMSYQEILKLLPWKGLIRFSGTFPCWLEK